MTEPDVAIGIDLATAHVRAVAVQLSSPATVIAQAATPLATPVTHDHGHIEQDATYARATRDVLGEISRSLSPQQRQLVRAISITGTSGTVVALRADGTPEGPALMYNDTRGNSFLEDVERREVGDRPTATLGRLAWLARRYPGARLATSADVATFFLAGQPLGLSDTSHWVKAGIDVRDGSWPPTTLENLKISSSLLPSLVRPGVSLGTLAPALARELRLNDGVVLVAGMTDGCTSQIATGAVLPGDSVGVLGTTFVLKAVSDNAIGIPQMGVYSHGAPDRSWWPGGASNTGAGARPEPFAGLASAELEALGAQALTQGPASHVRYCLPRRGERFPFVATEIESFSTGEPLDTVDYYRSFLEGVAFAERYGREILRKAGVGQERHLISGGASKSESWGRIRATVLGHSIARAGLGDSGIGAAFLAGFAGQSLPWPDYISGLVPEAVQIDPLTEQIDAVDERYQEFLSQLDQRGLR